MSGDDDEALLQRAQARVGTVLKDKWTLDRLIGIGGMATVYAATHRNRKRGAVKMLHPELSADTDIRSRFLREGYVANSVDHPGVVRVDDDDITDDGTAFLVMELLEGESVEARRIRKGGTLAATDVLVIADQLLDVLAAAHEKGIVHRDLKPENLFLTRDGTLKVLDFGIARILELSAKSSATRAGSLMGTPAFMAPEQARGRWDDVDARTDLWAVGATMFVLLTGRVVHEAETPNEALGLAMMQPAAPIATVLPNIAAVVATVIDRSLVYDRRERFVDARAMQLAVRHAQSFLASENLAAATGPRSVTLSVPDGPVPSDAGTLRSQEPEVSASPAVAVSQNMTTGRALTAERWKSTPVRDAAIPWLGLGVIGLVVISVFGIMVVVFWRQNAKSSQTGANSVAVTASAANSGTTKVEPIEAAPKNEAVSIEDLPAEKRKPITVDKVEPPKSATNPTGKKKPIPVPAPSAKAPTKDPFAKRR